MFETAKHNWRLREHPIQLFEMVNMTITSIAMLARRELAPRVWRLGVARRRATIGSHEEAGTDSSNGADITRRGLPNDATSNGAVPR